MENERFLTNEENISYKKSYKILNLRKKMILY